MTVRRVIELTVIYPVLAICIVGTLSVVALPHRCPRLNANETAAIATLRNLTSAQSQFRDLRAVDEDRDGRGEYGTFRELSGGGYLRGNDLLGKLNPPMLSGAFRQVGAGGEVMRSGYCFRIYLRGASNQPVCADRLGSFYDRINADGTEQHWCAYAWPIKAGKGQRRLLFVDEDGVVYGAPLEAALEPVEPAPQDHGTRTWTEIR